MSSKLSVVIHPFYYSSVKRSFDVIVSTCLIIGLAPLMGLIGLAVFFTIGQPIIFKQQRLGWKNQVFWLYKFRTMRHGAENDRSKLSPKNEAPFPMFKLHQDPRFVGIGKWLSNTGLDELPQLLNIFKGEMSLIGPRPLPISEAKTLRKLYPKWQFRELVRPGIFSEWSLDANRHKSIQHWQKLDLLTLTNGGLNYEFKLLTANAVKAMAWVSKTSLFRLKLLFLGKFQSKSN